MKAKAWVLRGPDRLEMDEFEVVEPQPDQILVQMGVTSVCASDPKILRGHSPFTAYPVIMGHEFAGQVAEIGAAARERYDISPGDRVTVEPTVPCGQCPWCRTEYNYHKCRPLLAYGVTMTCDRPPHLFGGYGEYLYLLPRSLVYRVDQGTPLLAACLSSVIGNGVRWIKNLGQMSYGQSLAISGVGSQGLAALIAAREFGVGPIAILGLTRDAPRFELAREFGVDFTVDVETQDPLEAVPDLLGGFPDVVVETSGAPSAIQTALKLVKPTGRVAVIGLSGQETSLRFDAVIAKGVTIACDHAQAGNYKDAMKIIHSGKYAIEKINNVRYALDDLPRALEEAADPPPGFVKGAVVFD